MGQFHDLIERFDNPRFLEKIRDRVDFFARDHLTFFLRSKAGGNRVIKFMRAGRKEVILCGQIISDVHPALIIIVNFIAHSQGVKPRVAVTGHLSGYYRAQDFVT